MRVSHKRSLFGYSSKSVEKKIAAMRLQFETLKHELEAELKEITRTNYIILEEIVVRHQEINEHAELEKELEGLLQQTHEEHSKQMVLKEQPEIPLRREKNKAK